MSIVANMKCSPLPSLSLLKMCLEILLLNWSMTVFLYKWPSLRICNHKMHFTEIQPRGESSSSTTSSIKTCEAPHCQRAGQADLYKAGSIGICFLFFVVFFFKSTYSEVDVIYTTTTNSETWNPSYSPEKEPFRSDTDKWWFQYSTGQLWHRSVETWWLQVPFWERTEVCFIKDAGYFWQLQERNTSHWYVLKTPDLDFQ